MQKRRGAGACRTKTGEYGWYKNQPLGLHGHLVLAVLDKFFIGGEWAFGLAHGVRQEFGLQWVGDRDVDSFMGHREKDVRWALCGVWQ